MQIRDGSVNLNFIFCLSLTRRCLLITLLLCVSLWVHHSWAWGTSNYPIWILTIITTQMNIFGVCFMSAKNVYKGIRLRKRLKTKGWFPQRWEQEFRDLQTQKRHETNFWYNERTRISSLQHSIIFKLQLREWP